MAWSSLNLENETFKWLQQIDEMECGLCCLAMCLNQVFGDTPSTSSIKGMMGQAYSRSTVDRAGMQPTFLSQLGTATPTRGRGTTMENLAKYAACYRLEMIYHDENLAAQVLNVKRGRPMIIRVDWSEGGGSHWVVVPLARDGVFFVLDPIYGLHLNDSVTEYKQAGPGGKVWGRWSSEWLLAVDVMKGPATGAGAPVPLPGLADRAERDARVSMPPPLPVGDLPPPLDPSILPPPMPLRQGPLPAPPPPAGEHPLVGEGARSSLPPTPV